MTVDLDHPKGGKTVFEGREIGFCSSSCKARFEADPQRYLGEQRPPELSAPAGTKWVCPMDPEVEADRPGPCPRCGMALEPATPVQSTRVEWTCPMHPQIVRDQPGTWPDLRHGAGAAHGLSGRREPRAPRHVAPFLGERRPDL